MRWAISRGARKAKQQSATPPGQAHLTTATALSFRFFSPPASGREAATWRGRAGPGVASRRSGGCSSGTSRKFMTEFVEPSPSSQPLSPSRGEVRGPAEWSARAAPLQQLTRLRAYAPRPSVVPKSIRLGTKCTKCTKRVASRFRIDPTSHKKWPIFLARSQGDAVAPRAARTRRGYVLDCLLTSPARMRPPFTTKKRYGYLQDCDETTTQVDGKTL